MCLDAKKRKKELQYEVFRPLRSFFKDIHQIIHTFRVVLMETDEIVVRTSLFCKTKHNFSGFSDFIILFYI